MQGFAAKGNTLLLGVSAIIFTLAVWLVGEAIVAWRRGVGAAVPTRQV